MESVVPHRILVRVVTVIALALAPLACQRPPPLANVLACAEVGYDALLEARVEPVAIGSTGPITIGTVDKGRFSWTSTAPVRAVIAGSDPGANLYEYDPASFAAADLRPPLGSDGEPSALSYATFCYEPTAPAIDLEKATNGHDADEAPGPYVLVGDSVAWTYVVTNVGTTDLDPVLVTDDQGVIVTCPTSSLAAGQSMRCDAEENAVSGPYGNVGTASGTPPTGSDVRDSDPSHYVGVSPGIQVQTRTNDEDADAPPGPMAPVGSTVTWTYVVRNVGDTELDPVTVTDDRGVAVTCPATALAAGQDMACSATATATDGAYANVGAASGTPPGGLAAVTDRDASHHLGYYAVEPYVLLEARTNGEDADAPPGPIMSVGDPVTWTYEVTNKSSWGRNLTGIAVIDEQLGWICDIGALAVDESTTCSKTGTATEGQYASRATATASETTHDGRAVQFTDPTHAYGGAYPYGPSLDLAVSTNGQDAAAPPGPIVRVGDSITWTYAVTNTGAIALSGIDVIHDPLGRVCTLDELDPGEAASCVAVAPAAPGNHAHRATATAAETTSDGGAVASSDESHYFGFAGYVDLETRTNGVDADVPPGPVVPVGGTVSWTYIVTNAGNAPITGIAVADDRGITVSCPADGLGPGETMLCQAEGTAIEGSYANVGTVTATPIGDLSDVSDSDASHYLGVAP